MCGDRKALCGGDTLRLWFEGGILIFALNLERAVFVQTRDKALVGMGNSSARTPHSGQAAASPKATILLLASSFKSQSCQEGVDAVVSRLGGRVLPPGLLQSKCQVTVIARV